MHAKHFVSPPFFIILVSFCETKTTSVLENRYPSCMHVHSKKNYTMQRLQYHYPVALLFIYLQSRQSVVDMITHPQLSEP